MVEPLFEAPPPLTLLKKTPVKQTNPALGSPPNAVLEEL
jgi:hypothetical protein